MNLPPFTLYGLIGCPFCEKANHFLKSRNIPYIPMVANDDPIIEQGVKFYNNGVSAYPVLVSRLTSEIIRGFPENDYQRLAELFNARYGASVSSEPGSEQQHISEDSEKNKVS